MVSLSLPCICVLAINSRSGVADTTIDFPINTISKYRSCLGNGLHPGFSAASTKMTLSLSPFRSSIEQFRSMASCDCTRNSISFCVKIILILPFTSRTQRSPVGLFNYLGLALLSILLYHDT